ncbi:MAG: hypothetical protein WBB23_09370 [Desulforhopalus sp.]
MEPNMTENILPTHKCKPGHCLCNAIDTLADPPEVGRRIQAYSYVDGWEFITWHNGDQNYYSCWRPDMDPHPCQTVSGDVPIPEGER